MNRVREVKNHWHVPAAGLTCLLRSPLASEGQSLELPWGARGEGGENGDKLPVDPGQRPP